MFQNACRNMTNVLLPIIVAHKAYGRAPNVGIAAAMLLNPAGDILTAGHVLQKIVDLNEHCAKNAKKRRLQKGDDVAYIFLIGQDKADIEEIVLDEESDIGVLRLKNFNLPENMTPVKFRSGEVEAGELLCRVGFPFVADIQVNYRNNEDFEFVNLFPVPLFVNEAMVSRFHKTPKASFIETSSPGLRGQSGGPLVDVNGYVCGMQISTSHYPLEFTGKGRNQVLNVGRAVRLDTILAFLDTQNITHQRE
ncbi:MAG: serine protease [Chloroflexi bacterium]|nr:serine protease [Chloroflexota bacterium]